MTYANFLADMGERPPGTTLDRFPDVNGNYEPGNCRWAARREQGINRRTTKMTYEIAEEMRGLTERGASRASIATRFGVSLTVVNRVVHRDPSKRSWTRT